MAQTVKVVRNTLSATSGGTADFTSSGFGTPTAAIIIVGEANTTNNPSNGAGIGVGFWDGTNQRVVSVFDEDNQSTTITRRNSDDSYGAKLTDSAATPAVAAYTISAVTDGIRLTLSVDNTTVERYCTVILLAGVSGVSGTFTPNATQNNTQESASLGFAPKLVFFASIGDTVADRDSQTNAILSFGFAEQGGTHRAVLWGAVSGAADEAATVKYSEDRCVGQAFNGTLTWAGEVTTFGVDTFTMTTRDGASGSDVCFYLALGGDVSFDCGTLTTRTGTGDDVNATDIAPDALLLMLSGASSTTLATDSKANSLMLGMADDDGEFSHNIIVEDAAATSNTASQASATACVDLDSSAAAAKTDLCDATATLNASDFTLNYTVVDGTARKGWWVAFGTAAAGGNRRRRAIICGAAA